jgi:NAD+ synthase
VEKEKIKQHIVAWLANYAANSGMQGFVIGISGGIDSALTSTLCAHTGLPTLAVSMPIHQKSDQLERANKHMQWLSKNFKNVSSVEVNLSESFETLKNALPKDVCDPLSMANTRSRLRMTTLYAFSTHMKRLVAGTGNKIEDFGVGFYTKYGDGGVDVSPIADLTKTQVFALAAHLGIIEDILTAKPTDGLWDDDRSDEDQMGATYPELEWAMAYENSGKQESDTLSERQLAVLKIYRQLHHRNRHKMIPIPVCEIPNIYLE